MIEPVQPWRSLDFLPEGTVVAETHHGKHEYLIFSVKQHHCIHFEIRYQKCWLMFWQDSLDVMNKLLEYNLCSQCYLVLNNILKIYFLHFT